MINLIRSKEHKWILQKNISSSKLIEAYMQTLNDLDNNIDFNAVKETLKSKKLYIGRTFEGTQNTMGVRFSQMCFYMFGYKVGTKFMPSPMTLNILGKNNNLSSSSNILINLYSMQFPNPYSETGAEFNLYCGRLIVKLLLEEKIDKKLYIDEIIWFLPFIEHIDANIYLELVDSIIEYRNLSYYDKLKLFKGVKNYNEVFSNVTHELNYYFVRIFQSFGVFDVVQDSNHNEGNLFEFIHGNGNTIRSDAYKSRAKTTGYIKLSDLVINDAEILNQKFSAFDIPPSENSPWIFSKRDLLTEIYEIMPLSYLNCISDKYSNDKNITDIINNMIYSSKYGCSDGKKFEQSLKPFIELFRETENVEIISGSGNTDLLCAMREEYSDEVFKMNIEAKTRKSSLEGVNASRINNHLIKHGSKFCIIVAPKFAKGVRGDINGHKIVVVKAEELGTYCYRECMSNKDNYADFASILKIIENNYGNDITDKLRELTQQRYGISI